MIRVSFDPAQLEGELKEWWTDWSGRAKKARDKAIADGPKHQYRDAIWRDLKKWLLEHVFHQKCAYCESRIGVTDPGDAEHYRPKGKVTYLDAADQTLVAKVNGQIHPGYYWLAYDWRNLLPACAECNSIGKANHFPVATTWVLVPGPGQEDPDQLNQLEVPLLLHPYFDDPPKHLKFDHHGGVGATEPRGQESIRVYRLDRAGLRDERREKQKAFWIAFLDELKRDTGSAFDLLKPYRQGRLPYSRAILDFFELKWAEFQKLLVG